MAFVRQHNFMRLNGFLLKIEGKTIVGYKSHLSYMHLPFESFYNRDRIQDRAARWNTYFGDAPQAERGNRRLSRITLWAINRPNEPAFSAPDAMQHLQ